MTLSYTYRYLPAYERRLSGSDIANRPYTDWSSEIRNIRTRIGYDTNAGVTSPRHVAPYYSTRTARPRYTTGSHTPQPDANFWASYTPITSDNDMIRVKLKDEEDLLRYESIDLHLDENRKAHNTDDYAVKDLIVRRGQEFKVTVTLNRPIDEEGKGDIVRAQLTVGSTPKQSKGTLIKLRRVEKLDTANWGCQASSKSKSSMTFLVMPPADAIVGKYTLYVETYSKDKNDNLKLKRTKVKDPIIVLFNPWCIDDQVFMENEAERQEYVLGDYGQVYVGGKNGLIGRPWNFGQFEDSCLEAVLYLLENCYLGTESHANPIQVVRALSAMANGNDEDSGVLLGNWSGNYMGGKSPTEWCGSVAILDKYMWLKKPVKWGQCWVFSGLLVTLGRALGIPSRSVTNFQSAHDKDNSMTIDLHFDSDGRPVRQLDDSIWNFHVWNESWFRRPDMPQGNDGWQAYDSTPQEASEGMMRCGPAPVAAIRDGNVFLSYDTKFLFAEVNGDQVIWMVDSFGDMVVVEVLEKSVGKTISTKAVGSDERLDLTNHYKNPEGSEEERKAVHRAAIYSSRKTILDVYERVCNYNKDVDIKFDGELGEHGDMTANITLKNCAEETREVNIYMYANAKYYTGVAGEELGKFNKLITLEANQEETVTWTMAAFEMFNRLDEDATVGVYAMAKVTPTGQVFTAQDTLWMDKPDIEVKPAKSVLRVGEEVEVNLSFTNPLEMQLEDVVVHIEGPGIAKERQVQLKRSIRGLETVTGTVKITPTYSTRREREIIASLKSNMLVGITGSAKVTVKP